MAIVAGCDWAKGRWLCICRDLAVENAVELYAKLYENAEDLVEQKPLPEIMTIDIPIGLTDAGRRTCDAEARQLLQARAVTVFDAPIRSMLNAQNRIQADQIRRSIDGKGVGAQAWCFVPIVKSIDDILTPALQKRIREVHPEVCFYHWANNYRPLPSKRTSQGIAARTALIVKYFGQSSFDTVVKQFARRLVGIDDICDAFAALWTAERIQRNNAQSVPCTGLSDARGLRMQMWY